MRAAECLTVWHPRSCINEYQRCPLLKGMSASPATVRGMATITPKGRPEMHFSFVVVDHGKEMLAVETDADTVVSGTLVKGD